MAWLGWLVIALAQLAACTGDATPNPSWTPGERELLYSLSPLRSPPPSPANEVADDREAARLGHTLFLDAGLSADGRLACASCHRPDRHFSDGRPRAIGLTRLKRNTPSLIGAAAVPFVYWDGRKDSLWSQALAPLESPDEHGFNRVGLAHRIYDAHRSAYEAVFGPLPDMKDAERFPSAARPVPERPDHPEHRAWVAMSTTDRQTINDVFVSAGKALEAYQRRLMPRQAPFDRFVAAVRAGDDAGGGHLSEAAQRGLRAFLGPGRCVLCHSGPLFTDHEFHNLGLPPSLGISPDARGRAGGIEQLLADEFRCGSAQDPRACGHMRFLDPSHPALIGAYRTPSLRHAAATSPYMHTGQFETLEAVVGFYKTLPGEASIGQRDPTLLPIDRRIATADLVAFLRALQGPLPASEWLER